MNIVIAIQTKWYKMVSQVVHQTNQVVCTTPKRPTVVAFRPVSKTGVLSSVWQGLYRISGRKKKHKQTKNSHNQSHSLTRYIHSWGKASCTLQMLCQTSQMMLDTAFIVTEFTRSVHNSRKTRSLQWRHLRCIKATHHTHVWCHYGKQISWEICALIQQTFVEVAFFHLGELALRFIHSRYNGRHHIKLSG